MKIILFLMLSVLLSARSYGQKADTAKHAIGIFGESNDLFNRNGNASVSTVGLQYNKQVRKHFGYKLMLGYAAYGYYPNYRIDYISGDTVRGKQPNTHIDMGMIGGGITFERQFYRKLYFFTGFEARIGYGHGYIDTSVATQHNIQMVDPNTGAIANGTYTTIHDKAGTKADMFYAALAPSFGLKIKLRRFCIGTEFLNYINFRSIKPANKRGDNIMDFDFTNITQRLFVQYRF